MGFLAYDLLRTHDKFIGLGLLLKEHLYKGPRTSQEDGLLMRPSKYFFYLLVIKRIQLLQQYLIKESGDREEARQKISALAILLGIRNPESRRETSEARSVTCCKYYLKLTGIVTFACGNHPAPNKIKQNGGTTR